jgi:Putative auto-transporter adhesin, head GIN domain
MTTVPTLVPHRRPPRLARVFITGILVGAAAVATLLLANEWGTRWSPDHIVRGSGVAMTQSRTVPEFTELDAAGAGDVTVRVGGEQAVAVTADDNLIDRITTEVDGRTLVLGARGSFTTELPVTVQVTVPTLDAVMLTGSGVVTVENVDTEELTVRMPGTGRLVIHGAAGVLDVQLSGSGNVELEDLVARDAVARLSGFGRLHVHATGSLDASVSGTGTIVYSGDPTDVAQHVTGVGAVTRARP